MTTEIPTYEIGAVDGFDMMVKHPDNPAPNSLDLTNPIRVFDGTRFYMTPIIVGNKSLLYGPGYGVLEITGAQTNNTDNVTAPIALDPKTYIDNYGYLHIGKTNMNDFDANVQNPTSWIELTVKASYHTYNPSTGETSVEEWDTFKIIPNLNPFKTVDETNRGISYSALPANSDIDAF